MAKGAKERNQKAAADVIRKVLSETDELTATPQDKIIECLEAEVIKLKLEASHWEDKYLDMKKQFDELKVILRET